MSGRCWSCDSDAFICECERGHRFFACEHCYPCVDERSLVPFDSCHECRELADAEHADWCRMHPVEDEEPQKDDEKNWTTKESSND